MITHVSMKSHFVALADKREDKMSKEFEESVFVFFALVVLIGIVLLIFYFSHS